MSSDLRSTRLQRDIVLAELYAAEHISAVLQACATVDGGDTAATAALMVAFDFNEMQATAVLGMQVRRFTPLGIAGIRSHLADLDRLLGDRDERGRPY